MNPRSLIIGIAGGTGSGKTTVAASLAAALEPDRVRLIDADSYYRDLSHLPLAERHLVNFDHPDSLDFALLAEHLRMLKQETCVIKHAYDFTTHSHSDESAVIEPAPVIIVEGVLIFVPAELRGLFDLKVFLDEDADVRLLRRIRRDMAERGRTLESIARQYFEQVRPMHARFVEPTRRYADIVIAPGEATGHIISQLTAALPESLRKTAT